MVTEVATEQLRWIVALPLLAAFYHGVMIGIVRRPTPRWLVVGLSGGAALGAFLGTFASFLELTGVPGEGVLLLDDVFTWVGSGFGAASLTAELSLALDPLDVAWSEGSDALNWIVGTYSTPSNRTTMNDPVKNEPARL